MQRRVRAGRLAARATRGIPRPESATPISAARQAVPRTSWRADSKSAGTQPPTKLPARGAVIGSEPANGHAEGQWRGSPRRSHSGESAQARQARHGEPGQCDPLGRPAEGRPTLLRSWRKRVRRRDARGPDAAASLRPHRLAQGRGIATRDALGPAPARSPQSATDVQPCRDGAHLGPARRAAGGRREHGRWSRRHRQAAGADARRTTSFTSYRFIR